MRYGLALLILCVITGCAPKKQAHAVPALDVPQKCILGGLVNKAKCEPLNEMEMVCDKVVIKFACVEVKK